MAAQCLRRLVAGSDRFVSLARASDGEHP